MTRIKRLLIVFVSLFSLAGLTGLQLAPAAYASSVEQAKKNACEGIEGTTSGGKCSITGAASLDRIIRAVVGFLSIVVGIAAVIMIMVGGFKYVTAAGDASKISSAKTTIIYAIVGLVIVALAQAIVRFVIQTSTDPPASDSGITRWV